MNDLPLLTLGQVSERLNVSRKTLYYWVSRNEVPYLRLGRHLRFDLAAVLAFFEERTRARRKSYRALSPYGSLSSLKSRESRDRNFTPSKKE